MDILSKLNRETIIICSDEYKNKILDECFKLKKIVDFKIFNLNEFIKKMTFDYDTKTIYYVMKNYNLSYENALVYIQNLYYVFEKENNKKLNKLFKLKEDLMNNNLLIIDNFFKENIKNKKIIFYGISADYKYIDKIVKNYEIVNREYNKYPDKKIYAFDCIDEEINFVASSICDLIKQGIDIKKIKLLDLPNEYEFNIKNIFEHYGLYINLNNKSLYNIPIGKYFLDNLCSDIGITIQKLKEKFLLEDVNKIIDICNKYTWCDDFLLIKECLIHELKVTKKTYVKYDNVIDIVSLENTDDEYFYFMLGFNNENFPRIYKNDSFVDDKLCELLNIENTSDKNVRSRNNIINNILNTKNLILTYKKKDNFNQYSLSNLNDELNFEIENRKVDYSLIDSKLDYSGKLDKFIKYGIKDSSLDLLYSNIDMSYRTYDNNFKNVEKSDLKEYLNNKLLLSYTSIDNFYKCGFSYYLNNILNLDPFNETFNAYVGSFIHFCLSKKDEDILKVFEEFKSEFELTKKDEFFLSKIKKELNFVINVLNKQKKLTNFGKELHEQKIYLNKSTDMEVTLMGIIDKIMYMEKDNKTYFSIIDYKTGSIDTNLKYNDYGLQLQLPIYAYLVLNSHLFSNPVVTGIYYQKLLSPEIESTTEEEYLKEKEKKLKLMGLSTNNETILQEFDSTYKDSELIKSMKITSKGFSSYSKVFSEEEVNSLIKLTENKINEAIKQICNGDFKINPKKIGKDNISCMYCKFKDICYMTEDNVVIIEEGDKDA